MDDTPPLFTPAHRDSAWMMATPATRSDAPPQAGWPAVSVIQTPCSGPNSPAGIPLNVVAPPPAGLPSNLGTTASGSGTPLPESSYEGAAEEIHSASCECQACRLSNSLDPSESTVNPPINFVPLAPLSLDEGSLCSCFRHSGWKDQRRRVFEALKTTGQTPARITAFAKCGRDAYVMRSNLTERGPDGVGRHKYKISGDHCHDRLCTPCANLRSHVIRDKLMEIISDRPTTFITLTLSGQDEGLREKVDRLYKHFRALRIHPTWAEKVRGGAAFIEIKYSDKAKRWHPHLHIIADADFIPQQDLCDAWRSITHDSYIVDIRRVRDAKITGSYVTKYASKPMNSSFSNDPALLQEAVMALKGRRLCLTFGEWYGTPLTYAEDEELGDDLTDAGGYEKDTTLEQVLFCARRGDSWAIDIVRSLNMKGLDAVLEQRPDPPPDASPYLGE